jgi:hypothetical protein
MKQKIDNFNKLNRKRNDTLIYNNNLKQNNSDDIYKSFSAKNYKNNYNNFYK